MTIGEFLAATTADFTRAGIESARLDTLILLEDALNTDRAVLLAYTDQDIPEITLALLQKKRAQRMTSLPLAYIRGHAPFYGRTFTVNEHVLVPRPETEAMISLLKQLAPAGHIRIADIGTGSGCLGITAALELPNAHATLCDIDGAALRVAQQNITRHRVEARVAGAHHNLLAGLAGKYEVLLANLPYVPEHLHINAAAAHEPSQAIFSGPDGLDHYKRFWIEVAALAHQPTLIITESLVSQHHTNAQLARANGFFLCAHDGLAQAFAPLG